MHPVPRSPSTTTLLLTCIVLVSPAIAASEPSAADIAQLGFLQGRWQGTGPDGKAFFDEYLWDSPALLRSTRYVDASFSTVANVEGSSVELKDGALISTWGQFTWKNVLLSADKACFAPINAPSSFCWERRSPDSVSVTQSWTDADGQAQSYELLLTRVVP